MSTISPSWSSLVAVEDLFFGLEAKYASLREASTFQFERLPSPGKIDLRCHLKKGQGWSAIAYTSRANIGTTKWSRLRFGILASGARHRPWMPVVIACSRQQPNVMDISIP